MSFNPWHHVSPGEKAPEIVNGIIEISKGSRAKYEIDKETGMLKLDRVLYSSVYYPANYGFIPQSLGVDGDPLDIMVLSLVDIEPLCLVKAKVIGVMQMNDQGLSDDKILAVAVSDPSVNHMNDVADLPAQLVSELCNFFESYTKLENKKVIINEFLGKKEAMKIIEESFSLYKKQFPSK